MRTDRHTWKERNSPQSGPLILSRREQIKQYVEQMQREIRRAVIPDPSAVPGTFEWRVIIPHTCGTVYDCIDIANTKSEVRAKIKAALGSVPAGTIIQKTGREPRKEFIQSRVKELYERSRPNQSPVNGEVARGDGDVADAGELVPGTA